MHLFFTPDIETSLELPQEEAAHCLRVLRLTVGENIMLTDGKGCFYDAEISSVTGKHCYVQIRERRRQEKYWTGHLHLALGPTKNMDRMEWLAEKATEIGLDELSFLNCRFSERKIMKADRIDKILVSAMKQSLKARKPILNEMTDFHDFVRRMSSVEGQKYIAHCYPGEKPLLKNVLQKVENEENIFVLIGPEGDFSEEEVQMAEANGFLSVSLGRSRLRTETAALVAVHMMNLINQI